MKTRKAYKVCSDVYSLTIQESKMPADKNAARLFAKTYGRYFSNANSETLRQLIDNDRLLNNSPYGLSSLTPVQYRAFFSILAVIYKQTSNDDVLTTTEHPRGDFYTFVFKLSDVAGIGLFESKRTPQLCETILQLDNKAFIANDGNGKNKYYVNDFLFKLDTEAMFDVSRREFKTWSDADKIERLKKAKQIIMFVNSFVYNKLQTNFIAVKPDFFKNLKAKTARKHIVCKTIMLFVNYSSHTFAYGKKLRIHSKDGDKAEYYPEMCISKDRFWRMTAMAECYKEHPAKRLKDTETALEYCKSIGLLDKYRIGETGTDEEDYIFYKLNPKNRPHKRYKTKKKDANKNLKNNTLKKTAV